MKLLKLPLDEDPIINRLNKLIDDAYASDLCYLSDFINVSIDYYSDIEEPSIAEDQILIKLHELWYWLEINRSV